MDQVLGNSMSPVHVPVDGSIRVVLEEQVPFTVVVHHAVRIVHPAIRGCEMVFRTPACLPVGGIEGIRQLHLLPGERFGLDGSRLPGHGTAPHAGSEAEQQLLTMVRSQIERYPIINLVHGEGYGETSPRAGVDDDVRRPGRDAFLNREQQVIMPGIDPDIPVPGSQVFNGHASFGFCSLLAFGGRRA